MDRASSARPTTARPTTSRSTAFRAAIVLIGTTVAVGLLTGWLWATATPLPGYTVNADGGATTNERGLTEFVIADVVFCAIGLLAGIGLGIVAWCGFGRRLGWPVVPIAALSAFVAALLCWQAGLRIGPQDFQVRLGAAAVGDTVPIDLRLRAMVALAVWVLGACGAVLVATAVLRDPDDGYPVRLPWSRSSAGSEVQDQPVSGPTQGE